LNRAYNLI